MFEKEAEEYADKKICQEYTDGCMGFYKCKENCERYHNTKKYWQDGANFGYNKAFVEADKNLKAIVTGFNKADEWHSYAERPKERLNALCFDTAQNQFILGYYDIESDEWIKYGGYETITMDMWKKIVPPKESE